MIGGVGFLPAVLLIMTISGCAQEYPADEFYIRGHLNIPTNVPMTEFSANPAQASKLFGRQNLLLKAKFKFKDQAQFDDYVNRAQVAQKWNTMPVDDKVYMRASQFDRFQQADLKRLDGIKDGYWMCETTAGYGFFVPKPITHPCPPTDVDLDFLIAALDKESLELYFILKQDY